MRFLHNWGYAVSFLRLRASVLALVFGLGSFVGAIQAAPVEAAPLPPPACRYDDVLTSPRGYSDWNETLLDTIYMIPKGYVPPGLVSVSRAGLKGSGQVRSFVIEDLTAMAKAARKAGGPLRVVSAYRSYTTQKRTFQREVERHGMYEAKHAVARPGHSEHQLGVTIDFGAASAPGVVSQKFAKTTAGKWMKANAWKYGWIMSYPRNKTGKTCYFSEPWHFRYVGRDMAANVRASGLTLREYIWKHYQ
jgi:D-alanyl-D-alanine carboxypeptidase